MSFFAKYPVSGGGGVTSYATFSDFPVTAPNGTLAVARDTSTLYEFNGSAWVAIADPSDVSAISALTGDVTATGPGSAAATVVHVGGVSASVVAGAATMVGNSTAIDTPNTLVYRDSSGNFSAGIISATLSGTATSFSGSLSGDVTGHQGSTVVATVDTSSAANIHSAELAANAATDANTASTIVKRDAYGNFTAGTVKANLTGTASGNVTSVSGTAPVVSSGTTTPTISMHVADASHDGYLAQGDWSTFNGKQAALGFTPENTANKGAANGYVPLDASEKVPAAYLPSTLQQYIGLWDPSTNIPFLQDLEYSFIISSSNATVGATYTNNGKTFTVITTIVAGTLLGCTGTGAPSASGTLVKTSGVGDATIVFSSVNSSTNAFTYTVSSTHSGAISGLNNSTMTNFQVGNLIVYSAALGQWEQTTPAAGVQSVNSAQGNVTVNAINRLTSDVTTSAASGSQSLAATVASVGGSSASNVHSAELAANAAASSNTASTIVKRDGSGNFSAGTITANLTGNASGSAASFTGSLSGDVTGTQGSTSVAYVGGSSASNVHSAELAANAAASSNTASTIVKRDAYGNFLTGQVSGSFSGLVAGSAKNYIAESSFEDALSTNWVRYAGGTTTPTNGTGGSPNANVTFAASASSPLRGAYSGLLTKDANNRQGEGVNYGDTAGFVIDAVDENKVMSIAFDFSSSANYVSGDLVCYVYDVTNSTLITPATTTVPSGTGTFSNTFVATSGANYRLILHIATTNANAWTYKIDNVYLGPGQLVQGPAVGAWQSFTPSFVGLSASVKSGVWRRIGDSIEVNYTASGTITGSGAAIGFTLPNSLTANTTTFPLNIISQGAAGAYYNGSVWKALEPYLASSTIIQCNKQDANADLTSTDVTTTGLSFSFKVPVTQYSANAYLAPEGVEFAASTTGTWDAAAAAGNTVYGPAGAPISGALTAARAKVVQFQYVIQPTDKLFLEYQVPSGQWIDSGSSQAALVNWPVGGFGGTISATSGATATVTFYRYGSPGTTYNNATGIDWATAVYPAWRVRKASAAALAGFNVANTSNAVGLLQTGAIPGITTGASASAGNVGETTALASTGYIAIVASAGQYGDQATISLGAGSWMIFGTATFNNNGAVTAQNVRVGIGPTTGNVSPTQESDGSVIATTGFRTSVTPLPLIVNPSTTTSYYFKVRVETSTTNLQVNVDTYAVRIR